jgi:anthranilate phosphoribosyltransferase
MIMADDPVHAFVLLITDSQSTQEILHGIRKLPGIEFAYMIYGDWDILLKVNLEKLADLTQFMMEIRKQFPIKKSSTLIALAD